MGPWREQAPWGCSSPPSITLIIYGVLAEESIGQLFIAGVIPGIALAGLFSGYIVVRVVLNNRLVPKLRHSFTWKERLHAILMLFPVASLILLILGSIYSGLATPSEAAAIGALTSVVIAVILGRL